MIPNDRTPAVLGLLLGFDRELLGHPAGLREQEPDQTHPNGKSVRDNG